MSVRRFLPSLTPIGPAWVVGVAAALFVLTSGVVAVIAAWLIGQRDDFAVVVILGLNAEREAEALVANADRAQWREVTPVSPESLRLLLSSSGEEGSSPQLPPVVRLVPQGWERERIVEAVRLLQGQPGVRRVIFDVQWLERWEAWARWGRGIGVGAFLLLGLLFAGAAGALIGSCRAQVADECALRFLHGGGRAFVLAPLWRQVAVAALIAAVVAAVTVGLSLLAINPLVQAWLGAYGMTLERVTATIGGEWGINDLPARMLPLLLMMVAALVALLPALVALGYPQRWVLPANAKQ